MLSRVVIIMMVATAVSTQIAASPRAVVKEGSIEVALPADVLEEKEMRRQIDSGLTTVVVATLEARRATTAALRAEIRFELWDEEYLVHLVTSAGGQQQTKLKTFEALAGWWKAQRLSIATPGARPRNVRLTVEILPFSAEEQLDVQRWLVRSIATPQSSQPDAAVSHRSILAIVVGTGLRREPIRTWKWTIDVE